MPNQQPEYHWSPQPGAPDLDTNTAVNWDEWNPVDGVWERASQPPAADDEVFFHGSPVVVNRSDEPTHD